MKKIRVYELAKEFEQAPKKFVTTVRAAGVEIKSYMSTLDPDQADAVRRYASSHGMSATPPVESAGTDRSAASTPVRRRQVIRRRANGPRPSAATPSEQAEPAPERTTAGPAITPSSTEVRESKSPTPSSDVPKPVAAEVPTSSTDDVSTDVGNEGKLIRNDDGVIVGTRRRAEPKILGYIPVTSRRKPRPKRIEMRDAEEQQPTGRASRAKAREDKRRDAMRRRRKASYNRRRSGPANVNTEPMREEKRVVRVDGTIAISDLAHQMSEKASAVLKQLWKLGLRRITVNHFIDAETAGLVTEEFGFQVEDVGFKEEAFVPDAIEGGEARAPVVTVMGHVDHGKTSLLDYIREANVAQSEAGGITQHMGAYRVKTKRGNVVFLDTPGHEAFSSMRRRGADVTDIVVLVVAADDGVMPTTVEAIEHARKAEVPVVVAINKIDKEDANPGRVKQQLMEHQLVGEEFGGETIIAEISAKTGQGVPELLESLVLQSEMLELQAPTKGAAVGTVVESQIDRGRGPVATVLVQAGTLRKGDIAVAGELWGKVRALIDDRGRRLEEAGPSMPVRVFGLGNTATSGESVVIVDSDKVAKQIVEHRVERSRHTVKRDNVVSIQDFLSRRNTPVLPVVLKADVHGSLEALEEALVDLSTDRVRVEVVGTGVGPVSESDVKLAKASDALIIGFGVKVGPRASATAAAEGIDIETFEIIYEVLDTVRDKMVGLLDPEYREEDRGAVEVRALFKIPRVGTVAGCRVLDGSLSRHSRVRVVRDGATLHDGKISSLKVHRDDVSEVGEGRECGLAIEGFNDLHEGDRLEIYELQEVMPSLG